MLASRRSRKALVSAAVSSIASLTLASSSSVGWPPQPARVTLLYVGAEDCAPCLAWQHGPGRTFRASAEFARISYREAKAPTTLDILKDEYWPEDLRFLRRAIDPSAGVPLWLVVEDDRVVAWAFGLGQWNEAILPKIRSLPP